MFCSLPPDLFLAELLVSRFSASVCSSAMFSLVCPVVSTRRGCHGVSLEGEAFRDRMSSSDSLHVGFYFPNLVLLIKSFGPPQGLKLHGLGWCHRVCVWGREATFHSTSRVWDILYFKIYCNNYKKHEHTRVFGKKGLIMSDLKVWFSQ